MMPSKALFTASTLALASLFTGSVWAEQPVYNQVSLNAEVSTEVARDRMHVTLYTESQDKDPAQLAATTTRILNAALEQARKVDNTAISLGNRNSYPTYDKEGQHIISWRERAEIRLESADFSALANLTAELLNTLKVGSLYFSVSEPARKKVEDQLLKDAIAAFKARAQLTTEALGGSSYKIIQLNLNSNSIHQPPFIRPMMMKAERMADAAAAPEIESGTQSINVVAEGRIQVQLP